MPIPRKRFAVTGATTGAAPPPPMPAAGRPASPLEPSWAAAELARSGPPACVVDLDGTVLYANPRYRELAAAAHGVGADEDMVAPLFALGEAVAHVIAGGARIHGRETLQIGAVLRVFRTCHFPIRNDAGALRAVGGIYEDATAEAADWHDLLRTRERYDDLVRLAGDVIWETDAGFTFTYVSPRASDILGRHPRELVGTSLLELGTPDAADDPLARDMRSPFRDRAVTVERRDGPPRRLRVSGVPMFSEAGAFLGYRGTATDVSAEAEARASADVSRGRLSTAIENISEGFALYDADNRLVLCNSRFREYLADVHRVTFPGAPLRGILLALAEGDMIRFPEDGLDRWLALRGRAEADGEAAIEVCLASGRWLRVTDRPAGDGGIVSIVSDVTEGKEREVALRTAKDLAEQGSRSKSEFLANMSHELRTPLNAIIGFSEIMRAETLGPVGSQRYLEYLDDIIDSGKHLLGVISDILDVAKLEAGKLELNEQRVGVPGEMRLTARLFAEQAAEAGVALEIAVPDDLPGLRADQRKIRQILLNLVSNAVKFTPPGGTVTISAAVEADGAMAVTVADTGIGIREEDLATALAPFGQVESSLARRYPGTGLGLPLTRALVERHGGTLALESAPGRGTRVTVRFPRARVVA